MGRINGFGLYLLTLCVISKAQGGNFFLGPEDPREGPKLYSDNFYKSTDPSSSRRTNVKCPAKGYFAHPSGNCTRFISCDSKASLIVVRTCQPGYLFDPFKNLCRLPSRARSCKACFGRHGQRAAVKSSKSHFYQCVGYTPIEFRCLRDRHFDRNKKKCMDPNGNDQSEPTVEEIEEVEIEMPTTAKPKPGQGQVKEEPKVLQVEEEEVVDYSDPDAF